MFQYSTTSFKPEFIEICRWNEDLNSTDEEHQYRYIYVVKLGEQSIRLNKTLRTATRFFNSERFSKASKAIDEQFEASKEYCKRHHEHYDDYEERCAWQDLWKSEERGDFYGWKIEDSTSTFYLKDNLKKYSDCGANEILAQSYIIRNAICNKEFSYVATAIQKLPCLFFNQDNYEFFYNHIKNCYTTDFHNYLNKGYSQEQTQRSLQSKYGTVKNLLDSKRKRAQILDAEINRREQETQDTINDSFDRL